MSECACPHCGMAIYDDEALLCHFCGESLQRPSQRGVLGKMKYTDPPVIVTLIVLCAAAAFILLYIF